MENSEQSKVLQSIVLTNPIELSVNYKAYENRECGHKGFAYFFNVPSLTTFYTILLWQCKFQLLVSIELALLCKLENENILFQY